MPWLITVAVVLGAAFLAAYPIPVLVVGGCGLLGWGAITLSEKRTVTKERLKRRAEYEDWLWIHGDSRGMYGPLGGHNDLR